MGWPRRLRRADSRSRPEGGRRQWKRVDPRRGLEPDLHDLVLDAAVAVPRVAVRPSRRAAASTSSAAVLDSASMPLLWSSPTLTGLAADSVLGSGRGGGSGRRAAAVVLILAGAGVGAALLAWRVEAGLLLAAVVVLTATLIGAAHERRRRRHVALLAAEADV